MAITIIEPCPYSKITNVKCTGSGAVSGVICACGNAVDPKRGQLTGVWAKVYSLPAPPITSTHDPTAIAGSFDRTTGNWWFLNTHLVPNVPCTSATPTHNTALFVVWCTYAATASGEFGSTQIATKCATATNCDGTANPCQGISRVITIGATGASEVSPQARLETAPRQYKVQASQARGLLAALVNTSWLLNLRAGGCGCACAWSNEGDGVRVPSVELRPDDLVPVEWRLTLALDGHRIRYCCPARDWSPLGANRLFLAETSADGDELPKILTVSPV